MTKPKYRTRIESEELENAILHGLTAIAKSLVLMCTGLEHLDELMHDIKHAVVKTTQENTKGTTNDRVRKKNPKARRKPALDKLQSKTAGKRSGSSKPNASRTGIKASKTSAKHPAPPKRR